MMASDRSARQLETMKFITDPRQQGVLGLIADVLDDLKYEGIRSIQAVFLEAIKPGADHSSLGKDDAFELLALYTGGVGGDEIADRFGFKGKPEEYRAAFVEVLNAYTMVSQWIGPALKTAITKPPLVVAPPPLPSYMSTGVASPNYGSFIRYSSPVLQAPQALGGAAVTASTTPFSQLPPTPPAHTGPVYQPVERPPESCCCVVQ